MPLKQCAILWLFFSYVFGFSVQAAANAPVAMVLGQPLTEKDLTPTQEELTDMARGMGVSKDMALINLRHARLAELIVEAVLQDYAEEHKIVLDEQLVSKFTHKFGQQHARQADKHKTPAKNIQSIAGEQVHHWQIDKALYEQYGGTVIFSQHNPQFPVQAYLMLLRKYEKANRFSINNKQYQAFFWKGFEPPYQFEIPPEQVNFNAPWWLDSDVVD